MQLKDWGEYLPVRIPKLGPKCVPVTEQKNSSSSQDNSNISLPFLSFRGYPGPLETHPVNSNRYDTHCRRQSVLQKIVGSDQKDYDTGYRVRAWTTARVVA